jgi:hypothetical protein
MKASNINPKWTPILRIKKNFNLLAKGEVTVNRSQYPLVVAESRTIHKSQGLTQEVIVVDPTGNMIRVRNGTSRCLELQNSKESSSSESSRRRTLLAQKIKLCVK